jgi:hypothetical protein
MSRPVALEIAALSTDPVMTAVIRSALCAYESWW